MQERIPKVSVDILIIRGGKILLGLLTPKWNYKGSRVWGVPGRDICFGETIGETVKRNVREEFGCNVTEYKIISVNANYARGNHYIGIGVVASIDGESKVMMPEDWEKWEWFDLASIPDNLFPPAKNLIKCYQRKKVCVSE